MELFIIGVNRIFPAGLSGATYEIIQYLMFIMHKDNSVFYDHAEISAKLSLSIPTVKKAKAILLEIDIMRPICGHYMFSPMHACTVKGSERQAMIEQYNELPKWQSKKPETKVEG